jgi:uroporphyrinogen decarboxylase
MRYLDAAARKTLDRPPVWLMRQAGRYLPEYRRVREKVGFQEAVRRPEIAAELTLQPVRRFGTDAAILFADIMTPVEAMGVEMDFDPGPRLARPLQSAAELHQLQPADGVPFVLDAIRLVRAELPTDVALIGFCGAPFTLAAYLVEGGGSRDFAAVRALAASDPAAFDKLLTALADAMAAYLQAQLDAGADAVQIFDSWAGLASQRTFARHLAPALGRLLSGLDSRGVKPVTYFAPQAHHLLSRAAGLDVDVVAVDWRTSLSEAFTAAPTKAVQGNLDPAVLRAGPEVTRNAVREMLGDAADRPGYIVNVGTGLTPDTPVESVAALVDTVRAWPEEAT